MTDEELPMEGTMESAPLRVPLQKVEGSWTFHEVARLIALATGGSGVVLLVCTYVAFLGGVAGMPYGVTLALHLAVLAEALLIASAPFGIIAWGWSQRH